jgi:hypothetical protein
MMYFIITNIYYLVKAKRTIDSSGIPSALSCSTAPKMTRQLVEHFFYADDLKLASLSGKKGSKGSQPKKALDPLAVAFIIGEMPKTFCIVSII